MEESLLKYRILDVSLLFGKPIKIGNGAPTVTLSQQLILALINGDMKCIYTLMGHSAQFARDKYRCIFCYHNWETGESGADREIEDFESLCECHNLNPTDASLNFNIVQKPLIKLQTIAVMSLSSYMYFWVSSSAVWSQLDVNAELLTLQFLRM